MFRFGKNEPKTINLNLLANDASNAKMALKPEDYAKLATRFRLFGLTLAPHTLSGHNVCGGSTKICVKTCVLAETGRAAMPNVIESRINKTQLLFNNPTEFYNLLYADMERIDAYGQHYGFTPLVRLNVASDLAWSRVYRDFPSIRFYGYTKIYSNVTKRQSANVSFTYSWNDKSLERGHNPAEIFDAGHNIAAVVNTYYNRGKKAPLPEKVDFFGIEKTPVDGDEHDWRIPELDGRGNLIALRFKGSKTNKQKAIESGFCVEI